MAKALVTLILLATTRSINLLIASVKPTAACAIPASLQSAITGRTGSASRAERSAADLAYCTAIRTDNEHRYGDSMALERKLFQDKRRLRWSFS